MSKLTAILVAVAVGGFVILSLLAGAHFAHETQKTSAHCTLNSTSKKRLPRN
jgi:hypothetical protein